ncbi:putative Mitotic checkpoint protein BUB3.1 [Blattamonas nauphoetae]|uniref:Mitotic checkpoint protein BUB3.1 n=1 Tax=Blattamonas nauphoetae TaxID=2049346 RepID=A0ABQ9X9E6_9EUKA|nr:putative Mitotic checkpoint protein BUB3.1 [Blattamonas nauphoetae]
MANGPQPPLFQIKHESPIFSATFVNNSNVVTVGADTYVKQTDLQTNQATKIGSHLLPIRTAKYNPEYQSVATASWDHTVRFWTPNGNGQPVMSIMLPERVYGMDTVSYLLAVCIANNPVTVYDLRNPSTPLRQFQPLDPMSQQVVIYPSGHGIVSGAVGGRVTVSMFNDQPVKSYSFRTQRNQNTKKIHELCDIAMSPDGLICTAGGDKTYSIWDTIESDICGSSVSFSRPVTNVSFSPDRKFLAAAIGNIWERGPPSQKDAATPPQLCLHELNEYWLTKRKK